MSIFGGWADIAQWALFHESTVHVSRATPIQFHSKLYWYMAETITMPANNKPTNRQANAAVTEHASKSQLDGKRSFVAVTNGKWHVRTQKYMMAVVPEIMLQLTNSLVKNGSVAK